MDFSEAKFILSRNLNKQLLVFSIERQIGYTYKFHKQTDIKFACASCKVLGKTRSVTVRDGRIVGSKHPEDDHHADCKPVSDDSIDILDVDRTMRSDIRKTGKRPRGAYSDTMASISKRFRTSAKQADIISQFPTYSGIRRSLYRHRDATHVQVHTTFRMS